MTEQQFTCQLMSWHANVNDRQMPWKGEKDPYKIWLSEIILQQTRVEQGWNYYESFIKQYPTVKHLAHAREEEVFKLWEGLGYYNRCRNLVHTARFVEKELNGKFPDTYESLIALKGIGPYTAAAISAFAFNLPYAVVDGNVFRVLSRVFGIHTAIDTTEGKKIFTAVANEVLDKQKPAEYNQAIMDFGATICKPSPICSKCPLNNICAAFKTAEVNSLPVKQKTLLKKLRWFTHIVFKFQHKTLIQQRLQKDIWQNLYEFYLVETEQKPNLSKTSVAAMLAEQFMIEDFDLQLITRPITQQLTHQTINSVFIEISLAYMPKVLESYQWLSIDEIEKLPFPKTINYYLNTLQKGLLF